MTLNDAITTASTLRNTPFPNEIMTQWVNEIEGMVHLEWKMEHPDTLPVYVWPDDSEKDLQLPLPWAQLYYLYLIMMIDRYSGEAALYKNSLAEFNEAKRRFCTWYSLHYQPAQRHGPDEEVHYH